MFHEEKEGAFMHKIKVSALLLAISLAIFGARHTLATNPVAVQTPRPHSNIVRANYSQPLVFEPNRGQTNQRADYVAHGPGYSLFLSHGEALIALRPKKGGASALRMRPVGGNISARAESLEAQSGKANYFIGNKPDQWRTNISTYAKVRYSDVYPGIDMVYYGNQRQLEYDFIVNPGASPELVQLQFDGTKKIALESSGDLVMHTAATEMRWHKPYAYQLIDGNQRTVQCDFIRKTNGHMGFQVGDFDKSKSLIIDPELVFSTFFGGGGFDTGNAIAVDIKGNAYITGSTVSLDLPVRNPFQRTYTSSHGNPVAFVAKYNAEGVLVYSTYLGGSGFHGVDATLAGDQGNAIAVDPAENAYVTGTTGSRDFPTKNAFEESPFNGCIPCATVFVTKLDPNGSGLVYSTYLGGTNGLGDFGQGIAVDSKNYAYVTGATTSPDFPVHNAFQPTILMAGAAAFLTKFEPSGSAVVYSTYFGGSDRGSGTVGTAIAVDAYDQVYITGNTTSQALPTLYAFQPKPKDNPTSEAFVTKFGSSGTVLGFSTYLGGSGSDAGRGIALDKDLNIYITGSTSSTDFPIKSTFQTELKDQFGSAFVTKLGRYGTLVYSTYLGGSGPANQGGIGVQNFTPDSASAIAVDAFGQAYITGSTGSPDFPVLDAIQPELKAVSANSNFPSNAFVTKLDSAGCAPVYSTFLGGSLVDAGTGIALDPTFDVYISGSATSVDFPVKNAFQPKCAVGTAAQGGCADAFITKITAK
jgi:Beta-propeller repeat